MGKLHIFCRLDFLVFSQHYWTITARFSFPRTSGTNNSAIPVQTLMTPTVSEIGSKPHCFQRTVVPGMTSESFLLPRPTHADHVTVQSQPHKCVAGSHLITSCLDFLFFTFTIYFLSASCHVFSACKRQDAICIHKLPGDFYWTVKVTSLDIIFCQYPHWADMQSWSL